VFCDNFLTTCVLHGTDKDEYYSLPYHTTMHGGTTYGDYYVHDLETAINAACLPNPLHQCCVSSDTLNGHLSSPSYILD